MKNSNGEPWAVIACAAMRIKTLSRPLIPLLLGILAACATPNSDLYRAAGDGDTTKVRALVREGADVNFKNGCMTPLMVATIGNYPETVLALLEAGADPDITDCTGATAHSYAAKYSYHEISRLLFLRGVPRPAPTPTPTPSDTGPVVDQISERINKILATDGEDVEDPANVEAVRSLLERGADVNAPDKSGDFLVLKAARNGHIKVLKLLLDKGADVNVQDPETGSTALIIAAGFSDPAMVRLLLAKGADVTLKDKNGFTALTGSEIYGNTEPKYLETQKLLKAAAKGKRPR